MATDVKFSVKDAVNKQYLSPVTVSDELRDKFLRKSRASSIKLLPVSVIISAIVLAIIIILIHFVRFFVISAAGIICIALPIYAVYNVFATAKAIKTGDYEFLSGEITGKNDSGYVIRGLEAHNISPLIGKSEYSPEERVIVARLGDDLSLIAEE